MPKVKISSMRYMILYNISFIKCLSIRFVGVSHTWLALHEEILNNNKMPSHYKSHIKTSTCCPHGSRSVIKCSK